MVCNRRVAGDDQGQLAADLKRLGAHIDQDSVLLIQYGARGASLLGTTHRAGVTPRFGEILHIEANDDSAAGRFLALLQRRELPLQEIPQPETRHGRWGQYLLAKKAEVRWLSGEPARPAGS